MKKDITFCMVVFIGILNFMIAQPVLNSTDIPAVFSANAFRATTTGYSNGLPGENQVWDYSTIVLEPRNYSYTIVPMSTTPDASLFPLANYCYKFNDNGMIIYNYYFLGDQSMEVLGYNHGGSLGAYSDTNIFLQFPYTYNLTINDTYQSVFSSTPQSFSRVYDGYGTLITPFGTFQNVIRQKETTQSGTSYYWIYTNPYQIILSGNFQDQYIYFWQANSLNTVQNSTNDFVVFPNPTANDFTIKGFNQDGREKFISIYDVRGNCLINNKIISRDMETLSLKDYSSGLYFIKITDVNNQILFSQKIVKN